VPITSSVEVSIPRECSRQPRVTFRGSSSPTCLACPWHGEVSGTLRFPIPHGGKAETMPSARGNTSRPEPVERFGAVSVFTEIGCRCLNHPGADESEASCCEKMNRLPRSRRAKTRCKGRRGRNVAQPFRGIERFERGAAPAQTAAATGTGTSSAAVPIRSGCGCGAGPACGRG
jgi:hypothetical protein